MFWGVKGFVCSCKNSLLYLSFSIIDDVGCIIVVVGFVIRVAGCTAGGADCTLLLMPTDGAITIRSFGFCTRVDCNLFLFLYDIKKADFISEVGSE